MSDVAFRSSDPAPEPAPAESVQLESKEAWREEAIKRGMPDNTDRPLSPAEVAELANEGRSGGRDDLLAKEMGRELNRQRERDGHVSDLAPLVEVKAPRGKDNYKDVREATADMTFNRRLSTMKQALDARHDPASAEAIAMQDGQFPPTVAPLANDRGELIGELGRGLTGEDVTFDNVYQATRALRNGRAVAEAAQQQWAQQQEQLAAIQGEERSVETAPQYVEQAPPPQPDPAPQPEQPQVDPLAGERQALAVQHQIAQLSTEERKDYDKLARLDLWYRQNAAHLQQVQADPARYAKSYRMLQQAQQAWRDTVSDLNGHQQSRVIRENALAQYAQAEAAQRYEQYKHVQDALFAERTPEMSDPAKARDMRNAVVNLFRTNGFTDEEVDNAWQGRAGFALRDHRVQVLVHKAAQFDRMMERSREIQRRPLPPPQRPGTIAINRAAEEVHSEIASLQRQLEGATGNKALKLSTALTQARRAAGLLGNS